MTDKQDGDWIGTKEAAKILGVTDSWVRKLIRNKKIPARKLGHDWLIFRGDAEVFQSILKLQRIRKENRKTNRGIMRRYPGLLGGGYH